MKKLYALVFLANFLGAKVSFAQQAWRPFRPGVIYAYHATPVTGNDDFYTFRVDSAYATVGGDSVYVFNRLLRFQANNANSGFVKSRNNLFGASVRWRPGQASYTLEATAQSNVQSPVSLELFPKAAVGSGWPASSQPARTATLASRSWQTISPGVQDTVAVINITNPAMTVRLSRRYGLLAAPQWLGGATGAQLEQAMLPTAFEQSLYSPVRLFDVQPGDEFGYNQEDNVATVMCYDNKVLRRVLTRRLTADSLIITYQQQSRYEQFAYGNCGPARVTYSPITVGRWALARAGNQWQATAAGLPLGALRLLTGEYVNGRGALPTHVLAGLPLNNLRNGCSNSQREVSYVPYYLRNGTGSIYQRGVDYMAWQYNFGAGLATTFEVDHSLIYYRKTVNGVTQTCGSPLRFASLLPTRAAQAASVASLHPNPATETTTMTLAAPAQVGAHLTVRDALGRRTSEVTLSPGQVMAELSLSGQPAGLYFVQLASPNAAPVTLRLTKE